MNDPREHADEHRLLPGVIPVDLGGNLGHPVLQFLFGEQNPFDILFQHKLRSFLLYECGPGAGGGFTLGCWGNGYRAELQSGGTRGGEAGSVRSEARQPHRSLPIGHQGKAPPVQPGHLGVNKQSFHAFSGPARQGNGITRRPGSNH